MIRRCINSLLALVVALWSPVWCCCATPVTKAEVAPGVLATGGHCQRCAKDREKTSPVSPVDSKGDSCPMTSLRAWTHADSTPQAAPTPAFLVPHDLCEPDPLPIAPPLFLASASADSPADSPGQSLVALHCMLTV
jgi:hypothetical protein